MEHTKQASLSGQQVQKPNRLLPEDKAHNRLIHIRKEKRSRLGALFKTAYIECIYTETSFKTINMKTIINYQSTRKKPKGLMLAMLTAVCMGAASIVTCSCEDENPKPEIDWSNQKPPLRLNTSDSLVMDEIYRSIGVRYDDSFRFSDFRTWPGITLELNEEAREFRVTQLKLNFAPMRGIFPKAIGKLSELEVIEIKGASTYFRFPETICYLKKLKRLDIYNGSMSGAIPDSIGKLTELTYLRINSDYVSGYLPESIGDLQNLRYLEISGTEIDSELPKSLGKLKDCTINLDSNKLSGSFPIELASERVSCRNNNIEDLPIEIWRDEDPHGIPHLEGNRISTKIPKWVTEQKKWKENKHKIESQQEGYGYELE
jgi:hypothetical protein